MKNAPLFLLFLFLAACAKTPQPSPPMPTQKVCTDLLAPASRAAASPWAETLDRAPRLLENLDSLIQARGYYVWLEISASGNVVAEYGSNDFGPISCDSAIMRHGVLGYGTAWITTATASNFKVGVTVWPSGTLPGSEIIEMTSPQTHRTWILRVDVLPSGAGLAFCTSYDGYAVEGAQTGRITAYYRDPAGAFFEVTAQNVEACLLTVQDCCENYTNSATGFINFTTTTVPDADITLLVGVTVLATSVDITHASFPVISNRYFGTFRDPLAPNDLPPGSRDYILQPGEVIGEFTTY
jgi:hypothetical protein